MSLRAHAVRYLALAVFAAVAGMGVAQGAESAGEKAEKARKAIIDEKVSEANSQAQALIRESEKLRKQYAEATEETKKAILEKIQEKNKALEELTARIARQIRDETRKARGEGTRK